MKFENQVGMWLLTLREKAMEVVLLVFVGSLS